MRQNLLNVLMQRGVLHDQKQDEEPREKMVAAAPMFPEQLHEAFSSYLFAILRTVHQSPADQGARALRFADVRIRFL